MKLKIENIYAYVPGFFLVPMANMAVCKVQNSVHFETWDEHSKYLDNLSPYRQWYDGIYNGFFLGGTNSFWDLVTITGQVFFVGLLCEIFLFKPKGQSLDIIDTLLRRVVVFAFLFIAISMIGQWY